MKRTIIVPGVFAALLALLLFPAGAAADDSIGPGSGEELPSATKAPKLQHRTWRFSRARVAKQRRLSELKWRLGLLRKAVRAMGRNARAQVRTYDRQRAVFTRRASYFRTNWRKLHTMTGQRATTPLMDQLARIGPWRAFSADTANWRQALSRRNRADGDDFYMYSTTRLPRHFINRQSYAIQFKVRGFDFEGREQVFRFTGRTYLRVKSTTATVRRRFMGMGLTPGWYEVLAWQYVRRFNALTRRFYGSFRVTQVNPLISAPGASYLRRVDPAVVKISRVTVRSPRGKFDPQNFVVRGRYKVGKSIVKPKKDILIGAQIFGTNRFGRVPRNAFAVRTAFRFRRALRGRSGRFGDEHTTRVKDLNNPPLRGGKYVLRVWALVTKPAIIQRVATTQAYWAYHDTPITLPKIKARAVQ